MSRWTLVAKRSLLVSFNNNNNNNNIIKYYGFVIGEFSNLK